MIARTRHEACRVGAAGWAAPVAAVLVTVALAGLASWRGGQQVDRLLMTGLEAVLPLAAGVAAATLVARDGCRELHLSLPARYGGTLARRLGVLGLWYATLAVTYSVALWGLDRWSGPAGVVGALVWLAPTAWLAGLAVVVVLVGRSAAAATTVVSGVWLLEQLFAGQLAAHPVGRHFLLFMTTRVGHSDGWLANRLWLLASAGALGALAAALLARPDRLLSSEED